MTILLVLTAVWGVSAGWLVRGITDRALARRIDGHLATARELHARTQDALTLMESLLPPRPPVVRPWAQ